MKAIVRDKFGSPDVVRLEELEKPELTDGNVLVRVHASSVNRADWYSLVGKPRIARPMMGGILRPKERRLGGDFAGTVEAVGKDVTGLEPGDEVFGVRTGAYAEYVLKDATKGIARKPANVSFEEAATVPIAGLTALQALRDHGRVQPGQKVLINGASGGVGVYTVQIAKALGAHVTAVCSTRNVELVGSLGADRVIDYKREDFTRSGDRHDLMVDVAGSKSLWACRRVLTREAQVVVVGGPATTPLLGPIGHIIGTKIASLLTRQKSGFFVAKPNNPDLELLADLLASGQVKPVVERRYELSETPEALRYMGTGHVQSKLVITVS